MKSLNAFTRTMVTVACVCFGLLYVFAAAQLANLLFVRQHPDVPLPENLPPEAMATLVWALPLYYVVGSCVGAALVLCFARKMRLAALYLAWSGLIASLVAFVLALTGTLPTLGFQSDPTVVPVPNTWGPLILLSMASLFVGVALLFYSTPGVKAHPLPSALALESGDSTQLDRRPDESHLSAEAPKVMPPAGAKGFAHEIPPEEA